MLRTRRLCLLTLGLLMLSGPAIGQDMSGSGAGARNAEPTRRTPAMRERVYERLSEAQACLEMGDFECAQRLLDEVRSMSGLNSYEIAQTWNFQAYLYMAQDNYRGAIEAYQRVLEQPDIPLGMESSTLYIVSQLHFQQEQFDPSLATLDRWFEITETPGPDAYSFRAQIYYQLRRYGDAIEPLRTAIRIAESQGSEPDENWYRLLNVCYYEIEDYASTIEVLKVMVTRWPRREYVVQLSGIYGQEGFDQESMSLYEVAYEAGWLTQGSELVRLAQLFLLLDIPFKAGGVLDEGLNSGVIESSESNWRLLAQAWQLAREDEKAVPALRRAAELSDSGELHIRLAQSYQNLYRWDDCAEAAREAFRKGSLIREDQSSLIFGHCLLELKRFDEARTAFAAAARDERSRAAAENWLQFLASEEARERQLAGI
jgi:tetratricopeptide (TPR) repeat protein